MRNMCIKDEKSSSRNISCQQSLVRQKMYCQRREELRESFTDTEVKLAHAANKNLDRGEQRPPPRIESTYTFVRYFRQLTLQRRYEIDLLQLNEEKFGASVPESEAQSLVYTENADRHCRVIGKLDALITKHDGDLSESCRRQAMVLSIDDAKMDLLILILWRGVENMFRVVPNKTMKK